MLEIIMVELNCIMHASMDILKLSKFQKLLRKWFAVQVRPSFLSLSGKQGTLHASSIYQFLEESPYRASLAAACCPNLVVVR